MRVRAGLAIVVSLMLIYLPAVPAATPEVVGKVQTKGTVEINGSAAPGDATVFAGDRIVTEKDTATGLTIAGGDQVFLPSLSSAAVSRASGSVGLTLERGAVAVVNRSGQPIEIRALGLSVRAANAARGVFEVALAPSGVRILARTGDALVSSGSKTVEVKEGTTLEAAPAANPAAPAMSSGGLGPMWTTVLVVSTAAGLTGLGLGVVAIGRAQPQDCKVNSPSAIVCL